MVLLYIHIASTVAQKPFSITYDSPLKSDQATCIREWGEGYVIYNAAFCVDSITDTITDKCRAIIRTDRNGTVLWDKVIHHQYRQTDVGTDLLHVYKGNLYVGFSKYDRGQKDPQYMVIQKYSQDGKLLWMTSIKSDNTLILKTFAITELGNIICAGFWADGKVTKAFVAKVDTSGKVLWKRKWFNIEKFSQLEPKTVYPLPNEEFLMTTTYCDWVCLRRGRHLWKMNAQGDSIWRKTISAPGYIRTSTFKPSAILLDDGNYAVSFNTGGLIDSTFFYPPCIRAYTPEGDSIWEYCEIPPGKKGELEISALIQLIHKTRNGDIIASGNKFRLCRKCKEPDFLDAGWIIRVSPEGKMIWQRHINFDLNPYFKYFHIADVLEDAEGNIVAVGTATDTIPGIHPPRSKPLIWILKLTPDGCLLPNCSEDFQFISDYVSSAIRPIYPVAAPDKLYINPNPTSGVLSVRSLNGKRIQSYSLYNLFGQVIERKKLRPSAHQVHLNLSNQTKGIYIIRVRLDNNQILQSKIIKQ